tara:strand:+ start:3051 stop:4217 length:1167 start_codon:yes stop_codon:yes gene_type:complete
MKEISVIIPTYNFVEVTKEVIEATLTQSYLPKEIIIIDSSESNAIEVMIGNLNSDIPVVYKKVTKLFPGEARNKGVKFSKYEWLAFLDSKTIPEKNWLERNINLTIDESLDVVFGSTKYLSTTEFQKCIKACTHGNKIVETTPGSLIDRTNFNSIGGFQEKVRTGDDMAWRQKIKASALTWDNPGEATLTYSELPSKLFDAIRRFFIYQLYGSKVNIQNTNKNIILGLFLILITLIIPKWNFLVGFEESAFYIPNITTIYVTIFFVSALFLAVFKKDFFTNKDSFLLFSLKIILFIILLFCALRWNYDIAGFVETSIYFVPHITKLYLILVFLISLLYRGLYFPIKNDIPKEDLLPIWWIKVGLLGVLLDLAKAPGYILGGIIKLLSR